jgi:hypothetical protein
MRIYRLLGAALVVLLTTPTAKASPVSYDFSGTFAQPVDGQTQFSGTFTYDTSLPLYPGANQSATTHYYAGAPTDPNGTPIGISLRLGNDPTNVLGDPIGGTRYTELIVTHSAAADEINVDAYFPTPPFTHVDGGWFRVTIGALNDNTQGPGPLTSLSPPAALNLGSFNNGIQFIFNSGGNGPVDVGTITSLTPTAAVPEPTTLAAFTILAAGLAAHHRWRATAHKACQRAS